MTDPEDLEKAAEIIRTGGVVAAETDTLVGLLALARDEAAVARVIAIKGAERVSPIPVLVTDAEMAQSLATPFNENTLRFVEEGWPGPLTLVVEVKPENHDLVPRILAGGQTIGVRVPGVSPARDLDRAVACPLTGTSANLTGEAPPRSRRLWRHGCPSADRRACR